MDIKISSGLRTESETAGYRTAYFRRCDLHLPPERQNVNGSFRTRAKFATFAASAPGRLIIGEVRMRLCCR
jgi:hypothetical protein